MTRTSGTLTFMFTDIEGSTQLWEQNTEAMQAALARHDHLLQSAIDTHDGSIIKTTGDGIQAVFRSGLDAVQAALTTQRAIYDEPWDPAVGRLRVRIGLLTGMAEERAGDYYGPAVNRAARLTAAARGGQILLSKTTQELVRDALPSGVSILDLGAFRLKGVARPERIYQLSAPDLPGEFPSLMAVPVQRSNLPHPRTPFVGRQQEVAAVLDLLRSPESRLVTLTGQGGTGKTRLALALAESLLPEFKDGAFFVDLAPLTGPDLLPSAVADVLGVLEASGYSLSELIQRHLRNKQLLLVLDNFEHVLPAADLLPEWLASSPGLTVLVTSREALNLMEEWLFPVGGLAYPEDDETAQPEVYSAVQLFVQSARRVRPNFTLNGEVSGVIRICRLVEGLPLAIELAASWARTMDTAAIATEIKQNTDFLATRLRNVPSRHRSMLAAFDYSWQQLEPPEQSAFAHLSVFRGGFERASAQAVAGASLPILSSLVDKSLLRWTSGQEAPAEGQAVASSRYHIHELLRQFGQEKLERESGQAERVRNQHGRYFLDYIHDLAPLMLDDRQLEFTARIGTEIENIRVAFSWAIEQNDALALNNVSHATANYYQFVGRYIEGHAIFQRAAQALAEAESTQHTDKALAAIHLDLAYFQIRLGILEQAREMAERAQAIFVKYRLRPEPGLGSDPRAALGILASIEGDYETTARYGEEIRRACEASNDASNLPFGTYLLVRAALGQGDYEAARRYAHEGLAAARATGERWFRAYTLIEVGNVEFALGNYVAARDHYEAAYAIRQEFNDPEGIALAAVQLGNVALREQKYSEAEERFRHSLEIYEEINDRGGLARSLEGLAQTAVATGRQRMACENYQKALAVAVDLHFVPVMLSILGTVGEFFIELKELALGLPLLARAASHPAGEYEMRRRAEDALAQYRDRIPADKFDEILESGASTDLLTLAQNAQVELLRLHEEADKRATRGRLTAVAGTTVNSQEQQAQPLVEPLTARELEVLGLIAQGLSNKEIAETLIVSTGTVKWYTSQIYGKLGVKSRTQAVAQAQMLDLLS